MTAFVLNISIDCREPLTLARFWSEVTGYTIDAEPTLDRVRLTRPWSTTGIPKACRPGGAETNKRWVVLKDPEGNEICLG